MSEGNKFRGKGRRHQKSDPPGGKEKSNENVNVKPKKDNSNHNNNSCERFVVLEYKEGSKTNFLTFKEGLTTEAQKEFGLLADMFELDAYPVPEEIPVPDAEQFSAANDPLGVKKDALRERIKERAREEEQMRRDRRKLFALMEGNISLHSRQRMERVSTFIEVWRKKDDPLALWKIIKQTHSVGQTGITVEDQQIARERYWSCHMNDNESLSNFKRRFDEIIKQLEDVGLEKPGDEELSSAFLSKLDKSRFAELRSYLKNRHLVEKMTKSDNYYDALDTASDNGSTTTATDLTRTLAGMFELASNFTVVTKNNQVHSAAVFNTTQENSNDGDNKQKNGGKKKKGNSPNNNPTEQSNKKANPEKTVPKGCCYLCKKPGHLLKFCPELEKASKAISEESKQSVNVTTSTSTKSRRTSDDDDDSMPGLSYVTIDVEDVLVTDRGVMPKYLVLLDNECSSPVFKDADLLSNIRDSDKVVRFGGILKATNDSNNEVVTSRVGDFGEFGSVHYSDMARSNVLSFAKIRDMGFQISYDQENDCFLLVGRKGYKYIFKRYGRLYGRNCRDMIGGKEDALVSTREYTNREVHDAKKAYELVKRLGYPSVHTVMRMITNGTILNCPFTVQDVVNAMTMFGPHVAAVKGKTKEHAIVPTKEVPLMKIIHENQSLEADVTFFSGLPFLISVSKPLGLTIASYLHGDAARSYLSLKNALFSHIAQYRARGFGVKSVDFDGEKGAGKLTTELQAIGVQFNALPPGTKANLVERKNQTIKEYVRAIIFGLPFKVGTLILVFLVYYAVTMMNSAPNKTGYVNTAPKELFLGRKLEYNRDFRAAFGDYCEVTVGRGTEKNSVDVSRTESAIVLLPTGGRTGAYKFLNVETLRVITADKFQILPMPKSIVDKLNDAAASKPVNIVKLHEAIGLTAPADLSRYDQNDYIQRQIKHPSTVNTDYVGNRAVNSAVANIEASIAAAAAPPSAEPPRDIESPAAAESTAAAAPREDEPPSSEAAPREDEPSATVATPSINPSPSEEVGEAGEKKPPRYNLREHRSKWNQKNVHVTDIVEEAFNTFMSGAEVMRDPKALKACFKEIFQHIKIKKTGHPIRLSEIPEEKRNEILKTFMFYKQKFFADGSLDKFKARLVADGKQQIKKEGESTSSPTVSLTSLFLVSAIAAKENRETVTIDFPGAFLFANVREIGIMVKLNKFLASVAIYIDPSLEEFVEADGCLYLVLDQALYGIIQASLRWDQKIKADLLKLGFTTNKYDSCIFNKVEGGEQITIALYVDDMKVTSKSSVLIEKLIQDLNKIYGEVQVHRGKVHSFLGMTFNYSERGKLKITMDGYIDSVLSDAEVNTSSPYPAGPNLFEIKEEDAPLNKKDSKFFHSMTMKLMYAAKRVRPDIALPVCFCATRVQSPTESDMKKLFKILRYVKGTKSYGLFFDFTGMNIQEILKAICYVDAAYGVHVDGKSHTGCIIFIGGGCIYVKSSKQKLVTKSSTEAELVALSDECTAVVWIKNFLTEQGMSVEVSIQEDNTSTIKILSKESSLSQRTRHVNVRYLWLKDNLQRKEFTLSHCRTEEMLADLLTKPLQGESFTRLRDRILNLPSADNEKEEAKAN